MSMIHVYVCVYITQRALYMYGRTKQLKDACIKIKIKVNQHTKECIRMGMTLHAVHVPQQGVHPDVCDLD